LNEAALDYSEIVGKLHMQSAENQATKCIAIIHSEQNICMQICVYFWLRQRCYANLTGRNLIGVEISFTFTYNSCVYYFKKIRFCDYL